MSDSVQPHRWQPTRLPRPWDSPGKNTGVGCHFLLQCMKVKSQSEVTQSYLTLSDPMDCSLPGSSIHGIFQARVLEWGAIAFSDQWILIKSKNYMFIGHKKLVYAIVLPLYRLCDFSTKSVFFPTLYYLCRETWWRVLIKTIYGKILIRYSFIK